MRPRPRSWLDVTHLASRRARPNIVVMYADDLGYGDLSCYGAQRVQTPNIDRLAKRGLRFTDAHSSAATCTPSRYSLLTGEYSFRVPNARMLAGRRSGADSAGQGDAGVHAETARLPDECRSVSGTSGSETAMWILTRRSNRARSRSASMSASSFRPPETACPACTWKTIAWPISIPRIRSRSATRVRSTTLRRPARRTRNCSK